MNKEQEDFIRRSTKVLQRIPSDPSAALLLIKSVEQAVATKVIEITQLGFTYGETDELQRLRKENAEIRAAAPKAWDEFVKLAEAKGYKTFKDKALAVGVDMGYLKTCRELNRVPFTLVQKLADAPDDSEVESRADRVLRRQMALEAALKDQEFMEFHLRHLQVARPLAPEIAERSPRSDMGASEFKAIVNLFFPRTSSDAARCNLLSVITGYTEFSHRSHAGLLKRDGADREPRAPSEDLAKFLRLLAIREEAHLAGTEMPVPERTRSRAPKRELVVPRTQPQ